MATAAAHAPLRDSGTPFPIGNGETVLVVDDEPTVRMLVCDVVEDMGYRAIEAKDGIDGLGILKSGRQIDLLVTDIGLPGGMDGWRLCAAARECCPNLRVLFITGYAAVPGEVADIDRAKLQILPKPFAMQDLAVRINSLMRGQ